MTLNQLRAFVMVAQHGGFSAAARALNMSHTTLSSQIQIIEREYGAELFHRRGRRVELSTLGLEMLPMARRMISLESDMRQMLDGSGKLHYGTLKLGAVSPYHVTELIASFHAVYPRIKQSVKLGNSELVLDDLDQYICDVGVVASCQPQRRYYMQPYARYPVIAFVRQDHPFARRNNIALEELAGEPLLMREEGSTTRKALEDALHERKIKVDVAMEIGSREALRESVIRGLGVGTVSESEYVPDPRLRVVRIQNEPVWTQIHVCCLHERRESRLVAAFFDAIAHHQSALPVASTAA